MNSEGNERLEAKFDSLCKKVLKNEAMDFFREDIVRTKNEVLLSSIGEDKVFTVDKYPCLTNCIDVCGIAIIIESNSLFDTLCILPEIKKIIIVLRFWKDMSDREISEILHIPRRTVQYYRATGIKNLKIYMEGIDDDEK